MKDFPKTIKYDTFTIKLYKKFVDYEYKYGVEARKIYNDKRPCLRYIQKDGETLEELIKRASHA